MFDTTIYRDYQLSGIYSLWYYFQSFRDGNPLVAMPTASGKSWVIGGFIHSMFEAWPASRVIMATHDENLISQNLDKLIKIWPCAPAGVFSAGLKRKEHHLPITFGGIQSMHKCPELFGAVDILIIDEAHLCSQRETTMYQKFISALKAVNPRLRVIGLSATCYRLGLGMLTEGGIFTDVCYDLTTMEEYNKLVDAGWLCPLVAKKTTYRIDVSDVGLRGGEYIESEQQRAVNKEEVTRAVLQELIRCAPDRNRWLIFATGCEHCDAIAEMLNQMGVSCVAVHSKLPKKVSQANYEAFKRGEVRACVNMNGMTTGVDIPEIDLIAFLRYTNSTSLWVQMLGRGTRIAPWIRKLCCIVFDFTTNTQRLGPINDPKIPPKPGKGKKGGAAPAKCCSVCDTWNHPSVRYCGGQPTPSFAGCGYEFPAPVKFELESSGLDVQRTEKVSEVPITQWMDVDRVVYRKHQKRNSIKPPSLLVSYFDGLQRVREWVCLEHTTNIRNRAVRWWRERAGEYAPVPLTIDDALSRISELKSTKRLLVWMKEPNPEIVNYELET